MANILDYLDWRGDIPFSADAFNEVDGLILSEFCYISLDGIVPETFTVRTTIRSAWERYAPEQVDEKQKILTFDQDNLLFEKLAASKRFGNTGLTGYVSCLDDQTQFSALTCLLDDSSTFVAFRGTDNSLVGWKEDMNLSYMHQTGSQSDALAYLNDHFRHYPRPLRLGGHSKGGNSALYAAAFCDRDIRGRILSVQTYDAPGFREEIVETPEYRAVLPKVRAFIPESSVVGLLLNNPAEPVIVRSSAAGIMQHLGFNWEVLCNRFVVTPELSRSGKLLSRAIAGWISQFDDEERKLLIDSVFGVLEATDADTFREIGKTGRKSYPAMLRAVRALTPEQQKMLKKALLELRGKK